MSLRAIAEVIHTFFSAARFCLAVRLIGLPVRRMLTYVECWQIHFQPSQNTIKNCDGVT